MVQQRTSEDRNGDVCSFRLVRADGTRLPAFRPSQYLTFKLEIPNGDDGLTNSLVWYAGVHVYAILPWLALIAMLISVASGMTGQYLLDRSRRRLPPTDRRSIAPER